MSDWLHVIEPMELALARMLAHAAPPPVEALASPPNGPLRGEVLAPAAERLAEADRQAHTADALLEDAALRFAAWRERLGALRARVAPYDNRDDLPAAPTGD